MIICRANKLLASLVVTLIAASSPVLAGGKAETVTGDFMFDGTRFHPEPDYGDFEKPFDPDGGADFELPLDIAASIWSFPFGTTAEHGLWVYANDEGRVRTRAVTGQSPPPDESQFAYARLTWKGSYRRGSGDPPTAIINRSWIAVFADLPGLGLLTDSGGGPSDPYASMYITVEICGFLTSDDTFNVCIPLFKHYSLVEGVEQNNDEPSLRRNDNDELFRSGADPYDGIDGERFAGDGSIRFEIPSREIDFDLFRKLRIDDGELYYVRYRLDVAAGQDANEHFAEAILGDPLDAGTGGITLNTTDIQTASNLHFCEYVSDPDRYDYHGDGTVTDRSTGLMWQRCPVGYFLDDRGTPDLTDDLCVPDPAQDHEYDWESALAMAGIDVAAGYEDWLLPNAKQLESITELSCHAPTVNTDAFPDTPAQLFWSSTPQMNSESAWAVGFANGEIRPDPRGDVNHLRLVRNSGTVALEPAPGLMVSDVEAVEGDIVQSPMVFTIALTDIAATDVSVDYRTESLVADDTADFVPTSGTVTIPAGARIAQVEVQIIGDVDAEGDEPFWMLLSNVRGDAFLRDRHALGTIIDDEPIASVRGVTSEIGEGDSGTQDVEFVVTLDKPAVGPVTVDYATADVTATAGSDYTAISGTVVFGLGDRTQSLFVSIEGDTFEEGDESFELELSNPTGGSLDPLPANTTASVRILDDDAPGTFAALNDTGVTYCANDATTLLACPQTGFPGQDGETGRDIAANDASDGFAGFSFTKLDEFGVPLADQQATYPYINVPPNPTQERWDCVQDEVTGLVWEIKTDVPDDLRHYDWSYSWFNPSGISDGGDAGFPDGGICAARTDCDTAGYVAAVNAAALCGFSDWRVPSLDELETITIYVLDADVAHGLDDSYFPHNYTTTSSNRGFTYWTSTPYAGDSAQAWSQTFESGGATQNRVDKTTLVPMRLVRGGQ